MQTLIENRQEDLQQTIDEHWKLWQFKQEGLPPSWQGVSAPPPELFPSYHQSLARFIAAIEDQGALDLLKCRLDYVDDFYLDRLEKNQDQGDLVDACNLFMLAVYLEAHEWTPDYEELVRIPEVPAAE